MSFYLFSSLFLGHAIWRIIKGRDAVALMALMLSYMILLIIAKILLPPLFIWQPIILPFILAHAVVALAAAMWLPARLIYRSVDVTLYGHYLQVYLISVLAVHLGLIIWIFWAVSWTHMLVIYGTYPLLMMGTIYTTYHIALLFWTQEKGIPTVGMIILGLLASTFIVFATLGLPYLSLLVNNL